ncbi:MAG TPA: 2OG-Fe(II) oxygenase family protein, partial [Xanthomonadales bacterium]|nr:2OG-Fe(II) oxygenase family protein [Xanthomonadales bacterium]
ADLARRGRTQVDDYLQPEAADALHACLARDVPWTLAYRDAPAEPKVLDHATWTKLDAAGRRAVYERCYELAKTDYAFAYESYMMVRAYKEGRDPGLLLHRILEFFNSPDYLAFARALTDNRDIRRMNAQATCYRAGQFLKQHNDFDADEGRQFAYVLNLTRDWHPDWGGLLQFMDETGRVVDTLMPRFNTLSIFKVPAHHCVTLVAPWAHGDRYAITGWMTT